MSSTLKDLVDDWLKLDQNPTTHAEIQSLWEAGNVDELEKRMRVRIEFGTAGKGIFMACGISILTSSGLRGRMEAGWARMNDLIVIQASQGLCAYVAENVENANSRGIVIGHDHRHNSERWAQLTAAAFIAKGVKAYLLHGLVHTPM
ncbi:hypothetical protein DXG01_006591 [Tephrocybe rancida]|nr:hypothetical protein DXG01_006591 [Tephrocybe rancida]